MKTVKRTKFLKPAATLPPAVYCRAHPAPLDKPITFYKQKPAKPMKFLKPATVLLALGLVLTLSAYDRSPPLSHGTPNAPAQVQGHGARDAADWDGRYTGLLPCASCPGIATELTLNEAGFYTLKETYLEKKAAVFKSKGRFKWNASGNEITLLADEGQRIFRIGEGTAWQVGADSAVRKDLALKKLDEFVGGGAQLYVDHTSVKVREVDGSKRARFDGLWNFEHRMQGGHRSLKAVMDINCKTRQLDLPAVAYFRDPDGEGKRISASRDNAGNWVSIPVSPEDVINQAAKAYCP